MKALMTILSLVLVSQSSFAVCEIVDSSGVKRGSVVDGRVFNADGNQVGRLSWTSVVRAEEIVGSIEEMPAINYSTEDESERLYSAGSLSDIRQQLVGGVGRSHIMNGDSQQVGSYSSECSVREAGAAAMILLLDVQSPLVQK